MSFSHSDEAGKKIWLLFESLNPSQEQRKEMCIQLNRYRRLTIVDVEVAQTNKLEILKAKAGDYYSDDN